MRIVLLISYAIIYSLVACTSKKPSIEPAKSQPNAVLQSPPQTTPPTLTATKVNDPFKAVFEFPSKLPPNPEQQKKLQDLRAKYEPVLNSKQKALGEILTPEQRTARFAAAKQALAAGKKGNEVAEASLKASKATPEQAESLNKGLKEMQALKKSIRIEISQLMDAKQKAAPLVPAVPVSALPAASLKVPSEQKPVSKK